MGKYAVGIDFGTLSARALVAEIGTGRELASVSMDYPHGVMDERLPDGTALPPDWALQHPGDYLDCLMHIVPEALKQAGIEKENVSVLMKSLGICVVTQFAADICYDNSCSSMAAAVELAGRIGAIALAMPMLKAVAELAIGLING